ncbi:MAG: hypothetical protein JNJ50_22555 [Acidobacteria bacterium]|nr:hypothetical protein [Acidobacteriota bacterium]
MLHLVHPTLPAAHEDLFLARYELLLAWALPLTEGDATAAEDLVHDAFVQFTLAQPDLQTIENLDGYLRQMLRNLRVSQGRRAAHKREQPLCIADYDSAELSLRTEEIHAGLSAREELRLICQYALARRHSSKAASVLMLRFFHGYLPGEIARVVSLEESTGRGAVKQWLSVARREARQFLHDPSALHFVNPSAHETPPVEVPRGGDEGEFLQALRAAIFAAPQPQACLSARQLKAIYQQRQPIETSLLAHLVCCARCLAQVNKLLRIAPQDSHFPDDPSNSSVPHAPKRRGLRLARSTNELKTKSHRRREQTLEHEPAELHIYANGFLVATHSVDASHNRLSLRVHLDEPLAFIEIFSEQSLRLLYLPVGEAPATTIKQTAHLQLSQARTLDATLNFASPWPVLELTYCGLPKVECGLEDTQVLPSLFSVTTGKSGFLANLKSAISNPQSAIKWLLRPLTITILLAALLIVGAVGQKLGWWFAAPVNPAPREVRPSKSTPERTPTSLPNAETNTEKSAASPLPALPASGSPVASPSVPPAVATAELELEALRLLQQANADTHEQIEVRRTAAGKLRIEGMLETDARKAELLQALSSLRTHPAIEIHLQTVAEAAQRLRAAPALPATAIEREEVTVTKLPVDAELRRHFTARGVAAEQIDDEIERFTAATLQRSRQMARHAGALRQLAGRFSAAQLQTLDAAGRAVWLSLLHSHARSLRDETLQLRASLAPVLSGSGASINENNSINNDEDLRRVCERVAQLSAESDRIVRAAFTVSANAAPVGVRSATFFTSLHRIEHLAEAISNTK